MKKMYEAPDIDIIRVNDILTLSCENNGVLDAVEFDSLFS